MHIKTNIEMSFVQLVILAICPLLFVVNNAYEMLYYSVIVCACFLVGAFVCFVFNRFMSKSIKVFVTALLSTFLITIFNHFVDTNQLLGLTVKDEGFFAVISTIILSANIIYIDIKASTNHYFFKIFRTAFLFVLLTIIYAVIKEFLAFGTLFTHKLFNFSGFSFFASVTFNFVLLGVICAVAEVITKIVSKRAEHRSIEYQKIVKKIRNEKAFQYDTLRRNKLLASTVETNKIDGERVEDITDKESQNETIDSELLTNTETEEQPVKRKKNKKFKASKETKIEKIFDKKGGAE